MSRSQVMKMAETSQEAQVKAEIRDCTDVLRIHGGNPVRKWERSEKWRRGRGQAIGAWKPVYKVMERRAGSRT